jgi:hypothetical protein
LTALNPDSLIPFHCLYLTMKLTAGIALLISWCFIQVSDASLFGTYVYTYDSTRKIELKKDHTFVETNGNDWRNGMWKLSHDTLVLQEGMNHFTHPHQAPPVYSQFFLIKSGIIYAGRDPFRKEAKK